MSFNYFDLASKTLSSVMGEQLPKLSFSIQDQFDTIAFYSLHKGTKKDDNSKVLVFIFDCKKHQNMIPLCKNFLRRSKTLRFPGILKFIDGAEIYIGFEWAETLQTHFRSKVDDSLIKYGLFQLASTLKQLGDSSIIHGNITSESVFVTQAGEWRIGLLDYISTMTEPNPIIISYGTVLGSYAINIPPEVKKDGWTTLKSLPLHAVDSWAFGCLIYETYNGKASRIENLVVTGLIPASLLPCYKSFLSQNPKARLTFAKFIDVSQRRQGFFDDEFLKSNVFLDEIALKSDQEKEDFVKNISGLLSKFPLDFCKYKILPEVIKGVEYSGLGSKALKGILDIGARLEAAEFTQMISPVILRLFASTDRSIRAALCETLPLYIDKLTEADINQTIFNNISTGFNDKNPSIREHTLKAVSLLTPKLNLKTVNNQLLRHLAKLQTDPEPGIRTNTIVCLVKIGPYLNESLKAKVLSTAFVKGLHDPFPFAKKAALSGLTSCDFFDPIDAAGRLIPNICPLLIHGDKGIRDQARSTINLYLKKLEIAADTGKFDISPTGSEPKQISSEPSSSWGSWAFDKIAGGDKSESVSSPITGRTSVELKQNSISSASTTNTFPARVSINIPSMFKLKADSSNAALDGWGDSPKVSAKSIPLNGKFDLNGILPSKGMQLPANDMFGNVDFLDEKPKVSTTTKPAVFPQQTEIAGWEDWD